MLNFKKISNDDLLSLQNYFARKNSLNCDFTLGVKFSWKDYFDSNYCIENETLFLENLMKKIKFIIVYQYQEKLELFLIQRK